MRYVQAGFSLIELMLAIAISAILMGITYPTYVTYQTHAERNRAETALLQLAGRLERYFTDNGSYLNATTLLLHAGDLVDGLQYQLRINTISETHYKIEAIPKGSQAEHDVDCGTLTLTDTNIRSMTGDGDVKQCWMV